MSKRKKKKSDDGALKPLQIVTVDLSFLPPAQRPNHPLGELEGKHVLFLGEISDMPGHCAVANGAGKVLWGYHTDNFRALTEDER